jgi:hypothetical protein
MYYSASAHIFVISGAGSAPDVIINGSGIIYYSIPSGTGTAVSITSGNVLCKQTSSRRYKKNITASTIDSSKLYEFNPVQFVYKEPEVPDFGYIAEEINEILPELINYDKEGLPESIKYSHISVLIIEELKKIRKKLEILEERSI